MKYQAPALLSSQGGSVSDFLVMDIVNFHGSGFEGSVGVDITVES